MAKTTSSPCRTNKHNGFRRSMPQDAATSATVAHEGPEITVNIANLIAERFKQLESEVDKLAHEKELAKEAFKGEAEAHYDEETGRKEAEKKLLILRGFITGSTTMTIADFLYAFYVQVQEGGGRDLKTVLAQLEKIGSTQVDSGEKKKASDTKGQNAFDAAQKLLDAINQSKAGNNESPSGDVLSGLVSNLEMELISFMQTNNPDFEDKKRPASDSQSKDETHAKKPKDENRKTWGDIQDESD